MRKQVYIPVLIAILVFAAIVLKFGPHSAAPTGRQEAAQSAADPDLTPLSVHVQEPSAPAPDAASAVAADSTPSNGLLTLRLNPSSGVGIASAEDQKAAMAMNEQFRKSHGQ